MTSGGEAEAGEGRAGGWGWTRAARSHAGSLATRRRSPRNATAPGRIIAGRPGTRQVPRMVESSPLGILAQRQVGLSFQHAPELLVRVGPLAGRGVRSGGVARRSRRTLLDLDARSLHGGPASQVDGRDTPKTRLGVGRDPAPGRGLGGGASRPRGRCPPAWPGTYHSSRDAGSAARRRGRRDRDARPPPVTLLLGSPAASAQSSSLR